MFKSLLIAWLIIAVAVGLTAGLLPGMEVDGGFGVLLLISAGFALMNVALGAILKLGNLQLTGLTLGLLALLVNAILLAVTAWLFDRLAIDNFFVAVIAALLISIISTILQLILLRDDREEA